MSLLWHTSCLLLIGSAYLRADAKTPLLHVRSLLLPSAAIRTFRVIILFIIKPWGGLNLHHCFLGVTRIQIVIDENAWNRAKCETHHAYILLNTNTITHIALQTV